MKLPKRNFLKSLACFSILSLSTSSISLAVTNTEDFTNVVTFGDSFVANANSYAQTLTKKFGFSFKTNETNFAVGGQGTAPALDQLQNYLNIKGNFGANDLVIYDPLSSEVNGLYDVIATSTVAGTFSGDVFSEAVPTSDTSTIIADNKANDFEDMQAKVLDESLVLNAENFPKLFEYLAFTENNSENFLKQATENGANYILMSNHFNEAFRQYGFVGTNNFSNIISREIGKALIRGALKVSNANVILWNEADLTQALIDSPSTYLTAAESALGDNPYGPGVFDVGAHATAPVNNIKRQFVASVITSPSLVSTLRENPLILGMKTAHRTFSVARNNSDFSKLEGVAASDDASSDSKFALQIFSDFGQNSTGDFSKKTLGFSDDSSLNFGVAANYKAMDNLALGMNVDYVDTKTEFVSNRGKANIKETALSVHGVYNFEQPIFIYGSAGMGKVNYDVTRNIALGTNTRAEKGKTNGQHLFSTLGTGYNYNMTEDIVATPFVAGHYQSVTMKDYSEGNISSFTSMDFRIPKRESMMAEAGMTISSEYFVSDTKVTPALTVSYLYDFKDPIDNKAQGRNLREYRYFKVPTYSVNKSNIQIQGNVIADITSKYKISVNAGAGLIAKVKRWSIGIGGAINL